MTPKGFFWVAERAYLLFDPKNDLLGVFWRNSKKHLRAPLVSDITISKWRHNSPSHWNDPKSIFLSCREGILAVWPKKQPPRCILKKVTKPPTSSTSQWRHNFPRHRNDAKTIFLSCRDGILAVWLQNGLRSVFWRKSQNHLRAMKIGWPVLHCETS